MSLRKSTCLTSQRLGAQRRNAQRSTGPRSQAGKERMRMNALKHGCDAAPENEAAVMRALGEDPEQFAALKQELMTAYGPSDALWDHQLDDLARLYWRRNRVERLVTGLMRDALEKVEEERAALARALAEVSFEPSQCEAVMLELPQPSHRCVRLRLLLSLWGLIREQVGRRCFTPGQKSRMESYYQGELGWRPRQISHLLGLFGDWAYLREHNPARLEGYVQERFGDEAGVEARYQELVGLVEEQMAAVEAAFEEAMEAQERKDAIARDLCLAPEDKRAERVLRLEAGLDRAIDRKVRILLSLRKEHAQACRGGWRAAPTQLETGPPGDELEEAGADRPLSACDSGQDSEAQPSLREPQTPKSRGLLQPAEVAPNFSSAGADPSLRSGQALKVSATDQRTESPAEERATETSKSPEQSQNVIENKAPAAEKVNA